MSFTMQFQWIRGLLVVLSIQLMGAKVQAAQIRVAVASNFLQPLQKIAAAYSQGSHDQILISSGSTGKLYAQIVNGAPFDCFLAASSEEPARLETDGLAVSGSRFTYAQGVLVLWAANVQQQGSVAAILQAGTFQHLALANPATAPYGRAARQVLQHLGLAEAVQGKLIRGENISQAYQYVATGAAELGFVAWSQLQTGATTAGKIWQPDPAWYDPIIQQAVLLKTAKDIQATQTFLDYLQSPAGKAVIQSFGYRVP